jgi:hypothetical protein
MTKGNSAFPLIISSFGCGHPPHTQERAGIAAQPVCPRGQKAICQKTVMPLRGNPNP